MNRRALLSAIAASAVAGCLGDSRPSDSGGSEPSGSDSEDGDSADDGDESGRTLVVLTPEDLVIERTTEQRQELFVDVDGLSSERDEIVLELDVSDLVRRGITLEDPAFESAGGDDGLVGEVIDVSDGVLEVALPTDGETRLAGSVLLSGLDTREADPAIDLEYGVTNRDGELDEVAATPFDLLDPASEPPIVRPSELEPDAFDQAHRISLDLLYPEDDTVRVTIDISALEKHGSIDEAAIDRLTFKGATVEAGALDDGVLTLELVTDDGSARIEGRTILSGIDVTSTQGASVEYDVSLRGAAYETASATAHILHEGDDD